ncbi:ladderlectin-like [Halichoeres trimaculatus]|uniref:ladderlectin-like n=1 Tax=Halichoeres trimaculatus TaxID=147232 RepID=UPI003D9F819D
MKILVVSVLLCAATALTAADGTMTSPWVQIARRYFAYVGKSMDWPNAERNCQLLGGHLASMHELYERNSIKNLINRYGGGDPSSWIGGSDLDREGTWEWTDGSPFDYDNWCWGQPNNKNGNNRCTFYNAGRRCRSAFPCGDQSPSVCVKLKGSEA